MPNRKLRLVLDAVFPDKAKAQLDAWNLENARQPDLFGDIEQLNTILVPVNDFNWNKFKNVLYNWVPKLIIDTRAHPHFFMIYLTIPAALRHFDRLGIEYNHLPLFISDCERENWEKLAELKAILSSYIEKGANAPVLFFLPNIKMMKKNSDKLEGCISQEIAKTQLERLER